MTINLVNETVYVKHVVVTDDNQKGAVVFDGNINGDDENGNPTVVPIAVVPSEAGFGDIHYSVDGGRPTGSQLLSENDNVYV